MKENTIKMNMKPLSELTLMDWFLFDSAMEDESLSLEDTDYRQKLYKTYSL